MPDRILIVDDDPETLRLISLVLQRQGLETATASDGQSALKMVPLFCPNLILLDIMMPDMDGYQVTRELRKMPSSVDTPILMFSAKNQVEDRVAGFEAGIDDYLTKPVHPAELVARIKSTLGRVKRSTDALTVPRGHMIAVLAAKGGLGTSTFVVNLAARFSQKFKKEVIAAELRPGHGTWGLELDIANVEGLNRLLRRDPGMIDSTSVENELVTTNYGARLLLTNTSLREAELLSAAPQMERVVRHLPTLAQLVLLDIGDGFLPSLDKVLGYCQEIFLVTDFHPLTLQKTSRLRDELTGRGYGAIKVIGVNRVRSDVQTPITKAQDILKQEFTITLPPAPEQSYRAAMRSLLFYEAQPDGLIVQQINQMADIINQQISR